MALRYNDQTGEFEEEGGGGSARRRTRTRSTSSRSPVHWGEVILTVGKAVAFAALLTAGDALLRHVFKKGGN